MSYRFPAPQLGKPNMKMRYLPRCYNDLYVPEDENGKKMNYTQNHDEYIRYIDWLAEYLYQTPIVFSEQQKKIVKICNKEKPLHAAIWISDCCGDYLWEREYLENSAREKVKYDEIVKEEYELWKESLTEDNDIDESFDEVVTTQEEYESIKFDLKLEENIPACPNDLDIPYRGVLRTLVLRCRTKKERRDVIKTFYDNFNETASK